VPLFRTVSGAISSELALPLPYTFAIVLMWHDNLQGEMNKLRNNVPFTHCRASVESQILAAKRGVTASISLFQQVFCSVYTNADAS